MSVRFRPLDRHDFPLIAHWLAAPHVAAWWRQEHTLVAVEAEYGPVVDGLDPTEVAIVQDGDRPVGLIQRYRLTDYPEWERAIPTGVTPQDGVVIDYLIGDETLIGRGLGGQIIARLCGRHVGSLQGRAGDRRRGSAGNRRSWRALEKSDFERIWAGMLDSDDPSDSGPSFVYIRYRPET